jgi:hypothetical protein
MKREFTMPIRVKAWVYTPTSPKVIEYFGTENDIHERIKREHPISFVHYMMFNKHHGRYVHYDINFPNNRMQVAYFNKRGNFQAYDQKQKYEIVLKDYSLEKQKTILVRRPPRYFPKEILEFFNISA